MLRGSCGVKLFICQHCQQTLLFENTKCERCGHKLGYLPDQGVLSAVEPSGANWTALASPGQTYRFCANWERQGCNWMVAPDEHDAFCAACRHNRTIPDISEPINHLRWQKIEAAKRRLVYTLINLRLPLPTAASGYGEPLVFDFLANPSDSSRGPKVVTGHDNGLITLSLVEADDAMREQLRVSMGERYRTLLGHFRHEIGHYYWDRLVRDAGQIESCRALFGDESEDYEDALKRYYASGAPPAWQQEFVSAYATAHPREDFAETFAHYLHIIDTLETARAFGIRTRPEVPDGDVLRAKIDFDTHRCRDINQLIDAWLPLTLVMNCINRSMGQPDLYPFVLLPRAIDKLGYIGDLIHAA